MKSFENKNQYQIYSKLKYKTNTSQKSNLYPIPTPPLKPSPWVSSMVSEVYAEKQKRSLTCIRQASPASALRRNLSVL